jgi:two-component system, LytTR family, sensor kinase
MSWQINQLETTTQTGGRTRAYGLWFCFWSLLALTESWSSILTSRSEGIDRSWYRALALYMPQFYLWMVLAPWITWLGRRSTALKWPRFVAIHGALSIVFAIAQTSAMLAIYWFLRGNDPTKPNSLGNLFGLAFIYQFHLGVIIYWLILAVSRGLEARRHLRDEKLRNAELQADLTQAQLHTLRAQLQPHFLFNTLNSISALALSDPNLARTMISRLSDLLRLSLQEEHALCITIARELQFLDCYLAIQQIRFKDRLSVQLRVGADVSSAMVPHLILQPLVENALNHGLLPAHRGGTLRITIERAGEELRLLIEDDGQGLPKCGVREGIGLGNTRARLAALGSSSLTLEPRGGGGTRVEARMPYRLASQS